jgi:hypothetical protein
MKIKNYLLPKNVDLNKENVLGIILGFHNILKNKDELAVLLYYDFTTGRIERFLVNTPNKNVKDSYNFYNDYYYFNKKKYHIDLSEEHIPSKTIYDIYTFNQDIMNDGKLSTSFFKLFMFELLRDYLSNLLIFNRYISYDNPNMNLLRKLTSPLDWDFIVNYLNNNNIKDFKLGSGILNKKIENIINNDKNIKLKDISMFYHNQPLIKKNDNLPSIIYVPYIFKPISITKTLSKQNKIIVKILDKKDYSTSLLDLKSSLKFKEIENIQQLTNRIKHFNYHIGKRLEKLEKIDLKNTY